MTRALALLFGAVGLGTLMLTVAARVACPWPLEWMEGATLQHALRLLTGQPLYPAPNAEFVPYLYPPLAYLPMALSTAALGPSLVAARVPSLLAFAGVLLLVARASIRDGQDRLTGWLAAGMFAAGYGYTGAFFDLARVDALFVLLAVAGAERLQGERVGWALALLAASAFAKQHGVWFLLAASAWLLAADARRHRMPVAMAWLGAALAYAALCLATDGWFHRYVFTLPSSHPLQARYLASFVFVDVLVYLPVLTVGAVLALRREHAWRGPLTPLLAAGLVAGALGRAHPGGHDNVRLPAFAMLVLVAVPPLARAMRSGTTPRIRMLATGALALQLAMLWQPPYAHRPPVRTEAAFGELSRALTDCADGGAIATLDYALPGMAPIVHTMALSDLMLGSDASLARLGTDALIESLRGPDAPRALAVGQRFPALDRVLRTHYRECARVRAPALATGHAPGLRAEGRLWQVVYAREPTRDLQRARISRARLF